MEKLKEKFLNLLNLVKKKWWYLVLLLSSSIYVFRYRNEIYQLSELNAQNLIFILWLILLILPLFSEVEIGSVKLKKEIEHTRSEVKEAVGELRLQIMDLKISNSNTVVFNQPLPTKSELLELEKNVGHNDQSSSDQEIFWDVDDDSIYLFKVRLTLEKLLSNLCEKWDYTDRKSMPKMVQFLARYEVIDKNIAGLIQEIIKIANCGVHGEIVSEDYISFVKKMFPSVKYTLEKAKKYSDNYYASSYTTDRTMYNE